MYVIAVECIEVTGIIYTGADFKNIKKYFLTQNVYLVYKSEY